MQGVFIRHSPSCFRQSYMTGQIKYLMHNTKSVLPWQDCILPSGWAALFLSSQHLAHNSLGGSYPALPDLQASKQASKPPHPHPYQREGKHGPLRHSVLLLPFCPFRGSLFLWPASGWFDSLSATLHHPGCLVLARPTASCELFWYCTYSTVHGNHRRAHPLVLNLSREPFPESICV